VQRAEQAERDGVVHGALGPIGQQPPRHTAAFEVVRQAGQHLAVQR
jgi:hypothetical protein